MPGIGSIHAQAVAMRERSERRVRFSKRHPIQPWSWCERGDAGVYQPERRLDEDRRQDHALAEALSTIREKEQAWMIGQVREMKAEIRRLNALVEQYREQSESAFQVGQASRLSPVQEA